MNSSLRDRRCNQRRSAILSVARDFFFEHGYGGTTMSAIAATLGGSKTTLWSHFSSKEALFAAVIDFTTEEFRSQMLDIPGPADEPLETLTRLCRSMIEQALSLPALALFRLITSEAGRLPDIGRIFYERGPAKMQQVIGNYLAAHLGDVLRDTDLVGAGRFLIALCTAGVHYEQLCGVGAKTTAEDKEAEAKEAAEVFWRAYRADGAQGADCKAA